MFDDRKSDKPEIAIVEKKRQEKVLPYSITNIGGPADLQKWKAAKAHGEIAYERRMQLIREAQRSSAMSVVKSMKSPAVITAAEKAEIAWKTGKPKLPPIEISQATIIEFKKLPVLKRLKRAVYKAVGRLWENANF